jgi:hypothetical protein
MLLISNLVKGLSHLEDIVHTDIDHEHFLDLLKVSNNVLLISNLVKGLSQIEDIRHTAIDQQHFLDLLKV